MVALDGDSGRGSGRSIASFDLHAALAACSDHLSRFGGHRAAAGFEIETREIEAFRSAFVRHAAAVLTPQDLIPEQPVDVLVPGGALGLGLAEELQRLAPFGHGNPEPTLLVPAARLGDVRGMGRRASTPASRSRAAEPALAGSPSAPPQGRSRAQSAANRRTPPSGWSSTAGTAPWRHAWS